MSRPTQVSMQDIAKAAGVSPQTVSRVANGSDAVKPETRQRVEAAMKRLGYRPNYAARALKHGRFQDIGVVMFNTATFGNARILDSIVANAADDDYSVTIQTMRHGAERTLSAAIDRMQRQPVDGVIVVLEERISDFVGYKPPRELPVVLICESAADHCPTVDADQYGCSTAIVDYLMSKGHKTVYHIAGPSTSRAAESRARGWREALEQMGARVPSMYIGDWSRIQATRPAWRWPTTPTARPSTPPTTKWHTAQCSGCSQRASACPRMSASWASMIRW